MSLEKAGRASLGFLVALLWLLVPASAFAVINSVTFPSPTFRPPEGPQPPQPAVPLPASQAVLSFLFDASAGDYRATVKPASNPDRIVTTRLFKRSAPAGRVETVEVTVPLDEGANVFTVTVQDLNAGANSRTSGVSPTIVRDLNTAVLRLTLDAANPPTRTTSATNVTLEFTLSGTAATYQIDVIRNAASATSFTTDRVGLGRVTVPLLPNVSNDFFLRATANDRLAAGAQVSSNILSIVQDSTLPTFSGVSIFPGPITQNAVVNVVGATESFAKVTLNNGGGKTYTTEADLAGNFIFLGVAVPLVPPGPTVSVFTLSAVDQANNRSAPFTSTITRQAADPRFEFLELTPPSGSEVRPGQPITVRGSVGERTGPFTVTFFVRATTGSFQIEEKLTNLGAGEAFEKDIHLTADVNNPNSNVIYSVEALVESTSGASPRQLVGEVVFDASDPPAPEYDARFDPTIVTNAARVTVDGAAERFSTVNFSAFPGVLISPSTRIPVDSTPIVFGGEFRGVIDLSRVIDGLYNVGTTVVAASGRFSPTGSFRELRFQRDTVPPAVLSVSINGRQANGTRKEIFGGGQLVTLRIELSEPMAAPPEVFVTQRGSFALPAALTATVLPDLIFEYTYVTLGTDDLQGPVDVVVTGGLDRAGNPVRPDARFPGLFNVDTLPPVLDPANTRPMPGTTVSSAPNPIFISILENPASQEPASGVDIQATEVRVFGPLETTPVQERRGFVNVFSPQSVTFTFDDGEFTRQGTYQVRITMRDFAGNSDTVDLIYKLDLEPISPVFVASTTPPDQAVLNASRIPTDGQGSTVLSATISSIVTAELDLARSSLTLQQACPAPRALFGRLTTTAPSTVNLVLDEPIKKDGSNDGQYLLRVFPRDVAGNATQNILRSFVVDTQSPRVQDGSLIELGRFGNETSDGYFPAIGQLVTGPLRAIRSTVVDAVSSNGYPGSGVNTSLATGTTIVMTLRRRHPTTSLSVPEGSSTTNNSLLQSVVKFRDIVPVVTSPCFTGPKRANVLLELRVDPLSGRPTGLTTGGLFDGEWEIRVVPIDLAGNTGPASTGRFIYDTVPPRVLSLAGVTNGDVLSGRELAIEGTLADNDKTPTDNGQGIDRVMISLLRADAQFVTTGAPLLEPTTATLSPNVKLVQAETIVRYRLSSRIPAYNGNAVLVVEAYDVAGNRTAVLRQIVIQNATLEAPLLSEPPSGSVTAGPIVHFRWTQVPGASGYRITITDPNDNAIVRTTDRATPELRINLDRVIEGRYTWTVQALDTAGNGGDKALAFAFTLDVTKPRVLEIFAYDATVPDARAGEILDGQIRIGIRFNEEMDPAFSPVVRLRPANPRLPEVTVQQTSYDDAAWRGLVDIQPDPGSPDFNGVALLGVTGARDLAGNVMDVTSSAFEIDVGPFWQVRAFSNPIQRKEILFHIKALTQESGVPERIEALPLLTVTQTGGPSVVVPMKRRGEAVFAGVYTVDQTFPGTARLAITGSDTKGNQSTRLVEFNVASIIAANRNQLQLPAKAGSLDLPAGSLAGDQTVVALGKELSEELEEPARGLVLVEGLASFLPGSVKLDGAAEFSVDLARFPKARGLPERQVGLYRLAGGRWALQPGKTEGGVLRGKLDGLSPLALMADVVAPLVEADSVKLEAAAEPVRVPVLEEGSGVDAATVRATIDGIEAPCVFDAATSEVVVTAPRALREGEHRVTVDLADRAGNKAHGLIAAHSPGHARIEQAVAVPNPARFDSSVVYRLSAAASEASVKIYDAAGVLVWSASGPAAAGANSVRWPLTDANGTDVASGVYIARIKVEGARGTAKIAVLR